MTNHITSHNTGKVRQLPGDKAQTQQTLNSDYRKQQVGPETGLKNLEISRNRIGTCGRAPTLTEEIAKDIMQVNNESGVRSTSSGCSSPRGIPVSRPGSASPKRKSRRTRGKLQSLPLDPTSRVRRKTFRGFSVSDHVDPSISKPTPTLKGPCHRGYAHESVQLDRANFYGSLLQGRAPCGNPEK